MDSQPTTIILFGITGDLAQKKIVPALYDLFTTGRLDNTRIVGFSRKDFSPEAIRMYVAGLVASGDNLEKFLDLVTYVQGQFDDTQSYAKLAEHLSSLDQTYGGCSNKLFYLSVPPTLYEMIARHLSSSGLSIPCGGEDGFSRILIEKPFGKDLVTARALDALLGELFREEQVYRIDHYVAKESLYGIIGAHRQDETVAREWNRDHIEKIEINLYQKNLVGSRGASYDGVGALRDVGQNHMLQMLALVAMDLPQTWTPAQIQKARADVLSHIVPTTDMSQVRRGQYAGYLSEAGVAPDSTTETFFRLTVFVDTEKFSGVPFVLSSGKALDRDVTEIVVHFKNGERKVFDVPAEDSLPAYEKILLDCIAGDQTVFISTPEILAEWAFITPVIEKWQETKLTVYEKGSSPENIV